MFNFSSINYTYFKLDALYFILLVFFFNIIFNSIICFLSFSTVHLECVQYNMRTKQISSHNINILSSFLLCIEFELWSGRFDFSSLFFFFPPLILDLLSAFTHPTDAHTVAYGWLILFGFFTVHVCSAVSFCWSAGGIELEKERERVIRKCLSTSERKLPL